MSDSSRSTWIWPLPGGALGYHLALFAILERVGDGVSYDELAAWLSSEYGLNSEGPTLKGYLRVPGAMGLMEISRGSVTLTQDGRRVLQTRDLVDLTAMLCRRVHGFSEVLTAVRDTPGIAKAELSDALCKRYGWNSRNLPGYRIDWLRSLRALELRGRGLWLTSDGGDALNRAGVVPVAGLVLAREDRASTGCAWADAGEPRRSCWSSQRDDRLGE